MKQLHYIVIVLLTTIWCSCENRITTDPTLRLSFSLDTLHFDTLFTQQRSTTLTVKVRNPNKEALLINSVRLREGEYFLVNLDGENQMANMRDIVLTGKDSMYLFVSCLPDRQNAETPILIEDEVIFSLNEQTQSVYLDAYGQDVRIFGKDTILSDTVLTSDLPYLVRDTIIFAGRVTIKPGTQLYMHDYAALFFLNNVQMEGTLEQPIRIKGDRLDRASTHILYDYISGRWNGVYLLQPDEAPACTWKLNYVEMNSGSVGIYAVAYRTNELPNLILDNSRIHNFSRYGLVLQNADARVTNCEISNCASYCVYLAGGNHNFVHNTIANYFGSGLQMHSVTREDVAAVYINNLSKEQATMRTIFRNNILTGVRSNNLLVATPLPQYYTGTFRHNYLRADSIDIQGFADNVYAEDKDTMFLCTRYAPPDYLYFDFQLDSVSPARGIADKFVAQQNPTDRLGHSRTADGAPDAGCYEWHGTKIEE